GGGLVKTSFFPSIASDRVSINLNMPQGTNELITDSIARIIEEAVWQVNDDFSELQTGNLSVIENIIKRIGPGTSKANITVNMLPGENRDFSSKEITDAIREKVGKVNGVESLTFGSGGNFAGYPVSISILGNNINELKAAKSELKKYMMGNPQLKDVSDTDPAGIKEINVKLKENGLILGLSLQSVMSQVRAGFFGIQAQRFQRGQDEVKIWVRYTKDDRSSIKNLDDMWINTPSGSRVPFSEIASYEIIRGEVAINHLDGRREIQVFADLKSKKDSPTDILSNIRTEIIPELLSKYPSLSVSYEGQNREAQKTKDSLGKVGFIILMLIYVVIAFTFRSYSQPLLLIFMVPFSLIGIVLGHFLHGLPINILSWLGIIALIGIMVNDGLVLVGKFNGFLKDGLKYNDALIQAGISRFRAIFLTSLTTVAGLSPLLFETSRQAQFLKPMAISISYGIVVATFLTLLMLPLLLSLSNWVKVFYKWLRTGEKISREEVERAIIEME
ncbi:MAG: MMPL family transporter, partial [Bacteroidales bacterium]|nr:MMPL family transporter [Bacteroidales bacterium]